MTYKTIVVHLDRAWRIEQMGLVFTLAQDMDAHLVGLHTEAVLAIGALSQEVPESAAVIDSWRNACERRTQALRAAFEACAKQSGHSKAEWSAPAGEALSALCTRARYADLVVCGQPGAQSEAPGVAADVHQSLALATGRPVLHVPSAGRFANVGRNVMIAWNASREASRAVADSLPLLQRAESVRVLVFNPGSEHGEMPGADIARYLARHGVKVTAGERVNPDVGIGELILSAAADEDADLIVMGAYGHSRFSEFLFGGATRTLLESMTVPVLMSH